MTIFTTEPIKFISHESSLSKDGSKTYHRINIVDEKGAIITLLTDDAVVPDIGSLKTGDAAQLQCEIRQFGRDYAIRVTDIERVS